MDHPELKPCPFCGGEAKVRFDLTVPETDNGRLRVGCDTVGCRGFFHASRKYYETAAEAIEAWNTRAERTGRIKEDETGFLVCSECGAIQPEEWTV